MSEPRLLVEVDEKLSRLKEWMLANASGLESIDLDTDIIENRLIDSLQFVSFLLFIEEVRGREIPEAEVKLDSLRTLRSIRDNFLLERR